MFRPSGEYIRHQTEIPKYLKKVWSKMNLEIRQSGLYEDMVWQILIQLTC